MVDPNRPIPTHKRCPHCNEIKPVDQFYRYNQPRYSDNGALHRPAGWPQLYCKPCNTIKRRETRHARAAERKLRPNVTTMAARSPTMICQQCNEDKPAAAFRKAGNNAYHSTCKTCRRELHA